MFGGLLRSDLLQLLALPFDVRGGAHLRLGVAAPLLRFLLPQHLGQCLTGTAQRGGIQRQFDLTVCIDFPKCFRA